MTMSIALPLWHIPTLPRLVIWRWWSPGGRQVCPRLLYAPGTGSYLFSQPVQLAVAAIFLRLKKIAG